MYNEKVNSENSVEEKERYLETLLELLKENPDTLREIGWDLPKGLIEFLSGKHTNFKNNLTSNRMITGVMDCFNELALNGNPKECILSACELVSTLTIDLTGSDSSDEENEDLLDPNGDEVTTDNEKVSPNKLEIEECMSRNMVESIIDLKAYVLFEFMISVLNYVDTLYPSKFLAMAISAIVLYVRSNVEIVDDVYSILFRVYNFCVSCIASPPSDNLTNANDGSDIEKILEDESILQKKLLSSLSVLTVGSCLKNKSGDLDKIYFNTVMHKKMDESDKDTSILDICYHYYAHLTSLDVDIKGLFEECLEESKNIYDNIPLDSKVSTTEVQEEMNQLVYEVSYAYEIKKLANEKNLDLDQYGVIILSAIYYFSNGTHLLSQLDIQSAVYLYLRCTTASLFSEIYDNKYLESAVRYWLWVSITETSLKDIKIGLQKLPGHIATAFLQMLLMKTCNESNDDLKSIEFELLKRILCFMSESTSYTFLFETLLHCPYITVKIAVLDILRDMMIKFPKVPNDSESNSLCEQYESINTTNSTRMPPKLPPRPYIAINEDRMASIHSVAEISFSAGKKKKRTQGDLLLVLTYMKFFVSLRNKWDLGLLTLINKEISEAFQGEGEPELAFINIANDTLGAYIEETSIHS
ncbi:ybp2p [Saccharomyces arboricola H-6]|uniref:Ybp2p n=1 Tax=Saccharomyces arboricola (strain H-6 / AS 2.3317 / CBS 10644) TaxID=1160507 RepID=J8Q558_SACAR|nr:ybp2p [Saccharomyces arboricola H-6]